MSKKKDEERNQRRADMAAKYPMQKPRTNVTSVIHKKEHNVSAQTAKPWEVNQRESLVDRNPTQSRIATPYPLRVNEYKPKQQEWKSRERKSSQVEAATKTIEKRLYQTGAADGWRQFQIDEQKKQRLKTERAYQRWEERFGESEFDDEVYRPGKNWPEGANNDFGFYYSRDKKRAYRYAKAMNRAYQQVEEAFAQSGDLGAKQAEAGLETANTVTDWLKEVDLGEKLKTAWEHHGEAQKSYGEAMKQQSENTADTAKRLWENHKTNVSTLAEAQAEQARAQTKEVEKAAQNLWGYVESNIGKINDVTQSNQMGAGVYGFLKSAAPDEQNEIENVDTQREALADSVTDNGLSMLGGFVGARTANVLQPLDLVKSVWEGGATGHVDLSGGEFYQIKDTIDDAISQELGEAFPRIDEDVPFVGGMGMDDLYDIIAGEADSGISLKLPGGVVHKGISAISEKFHTALEEAKRGGAEEKTALNYATIKSLGTGISEILDAVEIKKLNIMDPDDVFAEIISNGLKSGGIEIVEDGIGNGLKRRENWSENGQQNQAIESNETADAWRQGFFGEVLSSSAPEVIDAAKNLTKKIIKKIQAQK